VAEAAFVVAVLEKVDLEPGAFEHLREQPVVVQHLVVGCGVILGSRPSHLHQLSIRFVSEVAVGHGAAEVASRLQELEAECRGGASLLQREVLPDMLAQEGVRRARPEALHEVRSLEEVEVFFLGGDPSGVALLTGPPG